MSFTLNEYNFIAIYQFIYLAILDILIKIVLNECSDI